MSCQLEMDLLLKSLFLFCKCKSFCVPIVPFLFFLSLSPQVGTCAYITQKVEYAGIR